MKGYSGKFKIFRRIVHPRLSPGADWTACSPVGSPTVTAPEISHHDTERGHGGADQLAFENAIHIAEKEIHCNVPERIAQEVTETRDLLERIRFNQPASDGGEEAAETPPMMACSPSSTWPAS